MTSVEKKEMAANRRVVWCSMLLVLLYFLSLGSDPLLHAKCISPFSVTESTARVGELPEISGAPWPSGACNPSVGEKFYPTRLDRLVAERLNVGYLAINLNLCLGVIREN